MSVCESERQSFSADFHKTLDIFFAFLFLWLSCMSASVPEPAEVFRINDLKQSEIKKIAQLLTTSRVEAEWSRRWFLTQFKSLHPFVSNGLLGQLIASKWTKSEQIPRSSKEVQIDSWSIQNVTLTATKNFCGIRSQDTFRLKMQKKKNMSFSFCFFFERLLSKKKFLGQRIEY